MRRTGSGLLLTSRRPPRRCPDGGRLLLPAGEALRDRIVFLMLASRARRAAASFSSRARTYSVGSNRPLMVLAKTSGRVSDSLFSDVRRSRSREAAAMLDIPRKREAALQQRMDENQEQRLALGEKREKLTERVRAEEERVVEQEAAVRRMQEECVPNQPASYS